MNNSQKSWKGMPVTNQYSVPTPDGSGNVSFPINGTGIFQRIYSGVYGGYTIKPTDVVYKYVLGLAPTGCHYHGNTISILAGQSATWGFDFYIDPTTTGYPVTNYLCNFESSIGIGGSTSDPTPSNVGVWKRSTVTSSPASSSGTFNAYLYPGACGTQLATGGFILYKNPQVEINTFATPFVNGIRSNTQAIVDLTGNNTITANSLTYASDNTFSLDYASSSHIIVPLSTGFNKVEGTINMWVYPTRYNGGNGYFVNREDSVANAVDWLWIGPYSDTFYFRIGNGVDCCSNDLSFSSVATVIPLNTWTNMCFTWKANSTSAIYKNGAVIASRSIGAIPTTNPASNGTIGLGHNNADNYFHGKMPTTQIYNRQLSTTEVKQNFNALRGRYGI
jgi:hypothetical protein